MALLAISLGLLGIFGLARHGLKTSGDADQETRCALLADTILATLHAKNDELIARKKSLNDWWFYWILFASGDAQTPLFLPPMLETSESGEAVRIAMGTHALDAYLPVPATVNEIKWNPTYTLTLDLNGIQNLTNLDQVRQAYELGQIDVKVAIHPGALLSGGDVHSYSTTLTYSGGLP